MLKASTFHCLDRQPDYEYGVISISQNGETIQSMVYRNLWRWEVGGNKEWYWGFRDVYASPEWWDSRRARDLIKNLEAYIRRIPINLALVSTSRKQSSHLGPHLEATPSLLNPWWLLVTKTGGHWTFTILINSLPSRLELLALEPFRTTMNRGVFICYSNNTFASIFPGNKHLVHHPYFPLGFREAPGSQLAAWSSSSDCGLSQVCIEQFCVEQGTHQFILAYSGDDDLDLYVITPIGTTIFSQNHDDVPSGGKFGDNGSGDGVQDIPGDMGLPKSFHLNSTK